MPSSAVAMPYVTETFVPLRGPLRVPTLTDHLRGPDRREPTRQPPREVIERLRVELDTIGLPVGDSDPGGFGSETAAALERFQQSHGLPVTGNLDPTTGGVLSIVSLVASEHDQTRLRERLREARAAVPDSPVYNEWLARSALIAGDYPLARAATDVLRDSLGNDISPVMNGGTGNTSPRAPEIPFPENFYTYRYPLMADADIGNLRNERTQGTSGIAFMASVPQPRDGENVEVKLPPFDPQPLPPETPPAASRADRVADAAEAWLQAVEGWQLGNHELAKGRYASAILAYDRCQHAALSYFALNPDYGFSYNTTTLADRIDELIWELASKRQQWPQIFESFEVRRQRLSLAELAQVDGFNPYGPPPIGSGNIVYAILRGNFHGSEQPMPPVGEFNYGKHRLVLMDFRLLVIALVLAPMARGEAYRGARQFRAARSEFTRLLRRRIPNPELEAALPLTVALLSEFIEVPFARLLLIETLIEEGEAQYKARAHVDEIEDDAARQEAVARLDAITQGLAARQIAGDTRPGAKPLQNLVAAVSYADALVAIEADGEYLVRVQTALDQLGQAVAAAIATGTATDLVAVGQEITVPTVLRSDPELRSGTHPHEPLVKFGTAQNEPMRETNPRVYALLLRALARLLQIWSGFNYLGYRDDYLPPWRFAFLLERARYFGEHAKNAQRDYLNFLSNAENEELRELGAAQNVELEKANVAIETARAEQASREVTAARESKFLADTTADDAHKRQEEYETFSDTMLGLDIGETVLMAAVAVGAGFAGGAAAGGAGAGAGGGGFSAASAAAGSGGLVGSLFGIFKGDQQRDLEKKNLEFAEQEAKIGQRVAAAQLEVARAGLVVAGLQRQAALLRHAQALQTLQFMRNRVLNSEQWDRLAVAIRSVADTYLRYGIELAFLAQQAFNFEADKRLEIIRFDYDLSEVGAMLAADFLLRDLDALEHDQLVSQTGKLQQVRYVLSLAREYPEALRVLRADGSVTVSLRLEQLERRVPGLAGLRISSVELQPLALMDPTRVSVRVTHLGVGQVRLQRQSGGSLLDVADVTASDDWLGNAGAQWPIKLHVSGSETAVFTGVSRQEAASASAITAAERGAFEGLAPAAAWKIDMSMRENQVVPESLADVLITFVLGATFDDELDRAVTAAIDSATPRATTTLISARQLFPDAYLSLVRTGRMVLPIADRMLAAQGTPRALRNLSVVLPLAEDGPELGRAYCRYPVTVHVESGAPVAIATPLPAFELEPDGLGLRCRYAPTQGPLADDVIWDFGDDTPLVQGTDVLHTYAFPGRYELTARLVAGGELTQYRAAVMVSEQHALPVPLVVTPTFAAGIASDGIVPVTIALSGATTDIAIECSAGGTRRFAEAGSLVLPLAAGRTHVIRFSAVRNLSARFYGNQRYQPTTSVVLARARAATNRTFVDGVETTTTANPFTTHVFANKILSPVDHWTLELPLETNPWLGSVSVSDVLKLDASELADSVLGLEYLVGP